MGMVVTLYIVWFFRIYTCLNSAKTVMNSEKFNKTQQRNTFFVTGV